MKKFVYLFLLFCIQCHPIYHRVTAIQLDKQNTLYIGVSNPISVAVENYPSFSIILVTDNGEIRDDSTGRAGHYNIWPHNVGVAEVKIEIKTRKGIKVIDSTYYRVKRLSAEVSLGGGTGGDIAGNVMAMQIAPAAWTNYGEAQICGRFPIDSMTVIVIRKYNEIFKKSIHCSTGVRFDSEMTNVFYNLIKGDRVIITALTAIDFDGEHRHLKEMEFAITESTTLKRKTDTVIVIDPITGNESIIMQH